MVSANKNPSKRAAVGMTSHLCGRNVSSVRMAFVTNGRWTYWDRATIELKSNKDRELPNEPNHPVKRLRAGREISRLGSSLKRQRHPARFTRSRSALQSFVRQVFRRATCFT